MTAIHLITLNDRTPAQYTKSLRNLDHINLQETVTLYNTFNDVSVSAKLIYVDNNNIGTFQTN
jgi:hypothetical protein